MVKQCNLSELRDGNLALSLSMNNKFLCLVIASSCIEYVVVEPRIFYEESKKNIMSSTISIYTLDQRIYNICNFKNGSIKQLPFVC